MSQTKLNATNENFVSWLLDDVHHDDKTPIVLDAGNPSRHFTISQLRCLTLRLIAGLEAIGIGPGDAVCVNSFNDIYYNVLFLGIVGVGASFSGVNPAYSKTELSHHLQLTACKAVIVEPKMMEATLAAADENKIDRSMVFAFDIHSSSSEPAIQSWNSLLQHGEGTIAQIDDPDKAVALYATTSGTTGLPKAALIPHSYLIEQTALRISPARVDYPVRRLTALPPFHVFCVPIVPGAIKQGIPVYIMRRFDMEEYIKSIERYAISETYMPPPVLVGLPNSQSCSKNVLKSLRQIWVAGSGVSLINQLPLYNLLRPEAQINQVWGMTEVGWATDRQWGQRHFGDSVGFANPGFEIKIITDDGRDITPDGIPGDVLVHCRHPMIAYLNNEKATRETFSEDGHWLLTGDIGYLDKHGQVIIMDRKKELVKVRGWQVSPTEVENVIVGHPDVLDAAVIGVASSDQGQGEHILAYVVKDKTANAINVRSQDIIEFASKTLAHYKLPEEVVFTDSIPKNPTGKNLRRILREQARNPKGSSTYLHEVPQKVVRSAHAIQALSNEETCSIGKSSPQPKTSFLQRVKFVKERAARIFAQCRLPQREAEQTENHRQYMSSELSRKR